MSASGKRRVAKECAKLSTLYSVPTGEPPDRLERKFAVTLKKKKKRRRGWSPKNEGFIYPPLAKFWTLKLARQPLSPGATVVT